MTIINWMDYLHYIIIMVIFAAQIINQMFNANTKQHESQNHDT